MKIRKSSRITAIVLALMMIVPLISVPAFAEITATEDQIVISEDFENRTVGENATGNGLISGPSNTIVSYFDEEHGNVLKYDLTPDTTHKDGTMFIKSSQTSRDTWHAVTITGSAPTLDANGDVVLNEDGTPVVTQVGTTNINGTTYYFTDAVVNENGADTEVVLYEDATYTEAYTAYKFHLCTAQVRNAIQGQTNIATPSYAVGANGVAGTEFVFSADYYFDTNFIPTAMDIRMRGNNGDVHFANIKTSGNNLIIDLHDDLKEGIIYNPSYTVAKGDWFNLTVAVKSDGTKSMISMYVNGQFMAYGEQARAFSSLTDGWNIGHVQRGGTVDKYAGNYYVDNTVIYNTLDVIADWDAYDPNKIFSENFEGQAVGSTALPSSLTYKAGAVHEIVDTHGSKSFMVDYDTYDETTGTANPAAVNIDANVIANNTAVSDGTIVIDADYFIPAGAYQKIEAQLREVNGTVSTETDGSGDIGVTNPAWIQLYTIETRGDWAYLQNIGSSNAKPVTTDAVTKFNNLALPTGRWFTLSTLINLETGYMEVYCDGQSCGSTYMYSTASGKVGYVTDITIPASKVILAKMMKMNGTNPTGGSYPNGYTEYLLLDNINIYKADAPKTVVSGTNQDFSAYRYSNGGKAIAATASQSANYYAPSSAVYTDELSGNWAVKINLSGVTADSTTDVPFILGVNSRAYDIDLSVAADSFEVVEVATWDMVENGVLTRTGSINGTNDKPIYYAVVGTTVYVYNANGTEVTEENIGNLKYWATYELTEDNYNGKYRAMGGGKDANIDKNYTVISPELKNGTYVLSADYFVTPDANGIVQGQFYNMWTDLYKLDLANKEFETQSGEYRLPLIENEWNTVTMVVTLGETDGSVDVYLNGVYSHTVACQNVINENDWILAKPSKPNSINEAKNYAGDLYIDNVKVNAEAYDESKIQTVDASKVMGFDIDYKSVVNVSNSTELKVYVNESIVAYDADMMLNRNFSGIISTEDTASIRLDDPTGLRFATKLDTAYMARLEEMIAAGQLKGYNHGTLIAPLAGADVSTLTFENFVENVTMLDVESTNGMYYEVDGQEDTVHFVGSIINIKEGNMDRDFTGRGYFQITLMNGYVVTIYSATAKTISVADQAQATIDTGAYAEDSAEYAILAQYAAYAN